LGLLPINVLSLTNKEIEEEQMKILTTLLMAVAVLFTANVQADYGKQKVVYHINYDDPKAQAGALRNIQNHINAVGAENLDAKVVMHGNGLSLLLEPDELANVPKMKHANATPEMQVKISGLKSQNVSFSICANTLKGKKITLDQLYDADESAVVPSGVAELAHLQAQGYTYIKP
jgi:intracellular sulfur oxidation DsrE/DsrF family protein